MCRKSPASLTPSRTVAPYEVVRRQTDMDPESCYLGFEIRLQTKASKSDIERVFDFVRDDCDRSCASCRRTATSPTNHLQALLAPRDCTEIRYGPIQTRQFQETFDQSDALSQGQTKQTFQRQAELDR